MAKNMDRVRYYQREGFEACGRPDCQAVDLRTEIRLAKTSWDLLLMARILRRRIARHTPSAMSRRDTASEINQWLKLGLNAAQIGESAYPR